MVVFPFGAAVAAASMMRRNQEEVKKKPSKPTSEIWISVNDEQTTVDYTVQDDFDFARAAWALFKMCVNKGQEENLLRLLEEERKK